MREPNKWDYDRAGYIISLSQARAAHVLADYRAHDEAPLRARIKELEAEVATPVLVATNRLADSLADARAEIERLREALGRVVDHAEDWHEHYCDLWGERRKEQQDAILGDILNARAALAPPTTTKGV